MPDPIHDAYRPPASDEPAIVPGTLRPMPGAGAFAVVQHAIGIYAAHWQQVLLLVVATAAPVELLARLFDDPTRPAGGLVQAVAMVAMDALFAPALLYSLTETARTGRAPSTPDALVYGRQRWGETLMANVVASLAIGFGTIFFVAPGLYFAVNYAFRNEVIALERPGFKRPLERSQQLASGRFWRVLAIFALAYVPVLVARIALFKAMRQAPELALVIRLVLHLVTPIVNIAGLVAYLGLAHGPAEAWTSSLRWVPLPSAPAEPAADIVPEAPLL